MLMHSSTGISKYLRHTEAVSAKHYDFGVVEESARNRNAILNLIGGIANSSVLINDSDITSIYID